MYFNSIKINDHITKIINPGDVFSYLIEGDTKAILVDTGCGLGNLKEYVESLTDKEYVVVLTHGHVDHAGGASLFEKVYLNEDDFDLAKEHTQIEVRKGYLDQYLKVKIEDMAPPKEEGYLPLSNKQVFDLGNLHVLVFDFKGHTEGSIGLLIEEDGIAILGDACNSVTFLQLNENLKLSEYKETLKEIIKEYKPRMKEILFSHGHNTGTPEILNQAIEVIDDVFNGDKGIELQNMGPLMSGFFLAKPTDDKMSRLDGKTFNMVYRKEVVK